MHRLLALPLLFLAAPAAAQAEPATARSAFDEFAQRCEAAGMELWGKSLCSRLVIVDSGTRAAQANARPPLPGFTETDGIWKGVMPEEQILANTAIDWQGERWVMALLPLPEGREKRLSLLAHEAFHGIQPALGFVSREAANAHAGEELARVLFRLEAEALAAALEAGVDWQEAARDALAFNRARQDAFPAAAGDEAALLLNEGLAEYTAYRVGHGEGAAPQAAATVRERVKAPSLARQLGYIFGPAYGLLLDRGGTGWRMAAIGGSPLPQLLDAALGGGVDGGDWSARAGRYGHAAIAAEEHARAEATRARHAELRQRFTAMPVLRLEFVKMNFGFNPNRVEALGELGSVYTGANITDAWGELSTEGELLLAPDWSYALVPAPDDLDLARPAGSDWSLALKDGWSVRRIESGGYALNGPPAD